MGTAAGLLAEARKSLGMGEPNKIQSWYRERNGSAYGGNFAWCDAAVTYWARHSDNDAVLPGGDRAYTVYHAQDFQRAGRWRSGTSANTASAKPGDIVFFDWGGSNSIWNIDHVGVVERPLSDGRVQTIEGNTANVCARRVRGSGVIAGFGRPAYSGTDDWMEAIVKKLPLLKRGATGEHVQTLRGLLLARSHPEVKTVEGPFDATVEKAVRAVQTWGKVDVDGEVGPQTWPVLLRVH